MSRTKPGGGGGTPPIPSSSSRTNPGGGCGIELIGPGPTVGRSTGPCVPCADRLPWDLAAPQARPHGQKSQRAVHSRSWDLRTRSERRSVPGAGVRERGEERLHVGPAPEYVTVALRTGRLRPCRSAQVRFSRTRGLTPATIALLRQLDNSRRARDPATEAVAIH